MKLRTLFMMALLFAGVTFFTGCGDKEAPAAAATATTETTAAAESDEDQAKAACEKYISSEKDELEKDGITNLEFAKVKKVNDTYIMVLYSAKLRRKGDKPVAFHMKKKDGKWECVDFEDHWEPKDKHK